jgi:hypothetical protein
MNRMLEFYKNQVGVRMKVSDLEELEQRDLMQSVLTLILNLDQAVMMDENGEIILAEEAMGNLECLPPQLQDFLQGPPGSERTPTSFNIEEILKMIRSRHKPEDKPHE